MEQRDIIVIAGAILVVLFLALVVKPMLTGESVEILPPDTFPAQTPVPEAVLEPVATPADQPAESSGQPVSTEEPGAGVTPEATLTPGPEPTKVSWQPDPEMPMPAIQMVDYADITGKYSGSSAPFRIPTPYWELSYNITPEQNHPVFSIDVIEQDAGEEKTIRTITWRQGRQPDPKEGRFFEGGQDYYLNITAANLKEYRVVIRIPLKYLSEA